MIISNEDEDAIYFSKKSSVQDTKKKKTHPRSKIINNFWDL